MKKNKIREILWGIALVAAAVFLVLNQLHLFTFHLGFGTIFWTIIFGISLIEGIADKSLGISIYSITFLLIVYAEPLHITRLVPWTILLVATLLYLGLGLIFRKSWHSKIYVNNHRGDSDWSNIESELHPESDCQADKDDTDPDFEREDTTLSDEENIVINQRLSSVSRYVHSQNLHSVTINSSLGEVDVYLDEAKPAGDTITINLDLSTSEVNLYIPLSWKVNQNDLKVSLADMEIYGDPRNVDTTVFLTGRCNLGELGIHYV